MISAFGVDHGVVSKAVGTSKSVMFALTRETKMAEPTMKGMENAEHLALHADRNKQATSGAQRGLISQRLRNINEYGYASKPYGRRFKGHTVRTRPRLGPLSPEKRVGHFENKRKVYNHAVEPPEVRRANRAMSTGKADAPTRLKFL